MKVIEEKEEGLEKQIVEIEEEKFLVSTVDLLPPEMEKSFTDEIVGNIEERGEFETSIFPFKEGEPNFEKVIYNERYGSEEEALEGHKKALNKLEKDEIDL